MGWWYSFDGLAWGIILGILTLLSSFSFPQWKTFFTLSAQVLSAKKILGKLDCRCSSFLRWAFLHWILVYFEDIFSFAFLFLYIHGCFICTPAQKQTRAKNLVHKSVTRTLSVVSDNAWKGYHAINISLKEYRFIICNYASHQACQRAQESIFFKNRVSYACYKLGPITPQWKQ